MQDQGGDGVLRVALRELRRLPALPDRASQFHDAVDRCLSAAGLTVEREVFVGLPGRERSRVDLLARRGDDYLAIECDRRSPRAKSLAKLHRCFAAGRLLLLRWRPAHDLWWDGPHRGVHVLSLEVQDVVLEQTG